MQDHETMEAVSLKFVSWLRNNFPEIKEQIISNSVCETYAELLRDLPILFWAELGALSYDDLTCLSSSGESILERVSSTINGASPSVQNDILVSFVEAHMFPSPGSPLAEEMGVALDMDLSGLC